MEWLFFLRKQYVVLLAVLLMLLIVSNAVYAWTPPNNTPPSGSTAAPVNTGTTDQIKSAALGVDAVAVYGNGYIQNRLGIGNSNPAYGLHVDGGAGNGIIGIETDGNSNADVRFLESSLYGFIQRYNANNNAFSIRGYVNGALEPSGEGFYIERGTGSVGLGISNPAFDLHIDGGSGNGSFAIETDADSVAYMRMLESADTGFDVRYTSNADRFDIRGLTNGSFEPTGEGLFIKRATGNLGLGNSNPAYKLHVDGGSGDANIALETDDDSSTYLRMLENPTTGMIQQYDADSNTFSIRGFVNGSPQPWQEGLYVKRDTGHVGIGNANPDADLHVDGQGGNGTVYIEGGPNNAAILRMSETDKFYSVMRYDGSSNNFSIRGSQDDGQLQPTSEGLFIKRTTGNLGLGNSNPAYKLHVDGGSGDANIALETDGDSSTYVRMLESSTYGMIQQYDADSNTFSIRGFVNGSPQPWQEGLYVKRNTGHVGIGNANPDADLHVDGQGGNGTVYIEGGPDNAAILRMAESDNGYTVLRYDGGNDVFSIRGSQSDGSLQPAEEGFFIDRLSGKVGIGNSSPAYKLHIDGGTGNAGFAIESDGDSIPYMRMLENPNYGFDIRYTSSANRFGIRGYTNGSFEPSNEGFYIMRDTGRVGIGVSAPSYPLHVNGVVSATSFSQSSDARLKENIETAGGVDIVQALRGVKFDWKDTGETSYGVVAQEVENVLPELVLEDDDGYKSVQYTELIGILIEAVKEQQSEIDDLQDQIEALQ